MARKGTTATEASVEELAERVASDFDDGLHHEEAASALAELATRAKERDSLKKWQRAYAKGRAGMVGMADQDFDRAEVAEARVVDLEAALNKIASGEWPSTHEQVAQDALAASPSGGDEP